MHGSNKLSIIDGMTDEEIRVQFNKGGLYLVSILGLAAKEGKGASGRVDRVCGIDNKERIPLLIHALGVKNKRNIITKA